MFKRGESRLVLSCKWCVTDAILTSFVRAVLLVANVAAAVVVVVIVVVVAAVVVIVIVAVVVVVHRTRSERCARRFCPWMTNS